MQLNCLLEAIPGSGCSFGDTVCQCSSSVLQDKINACLAVNCTMQGRLGMYISFNIQLGALTLEMFGCL